LGTKANKDLGTKANKDLGNKANKDLGNKANKDLGTKANKDLGNKANKDLGNKAKAFKYQGQELDMSRSMAKKRKPKLTVITKIICTVDIWRTPMTVNVCTT